MSWKPVKNRPSDPVKQLLPDDAAICFTHGDLRLDNIMVDGEPCSRQISGVVDWAQAGWYPEYWEYMSVHRFVFDHEWSTQGWLDRVMERWPDADEAMATCWLWHARREARMCEVALKVLSYIGLPFLGLLICWIS